MLLPVLRAGLREAGVSDRLVVGSSLRFLAGGTVFFVMVAMPFFLEGAGRFLEGMVGSGAVSVVAIGTEDSRRGECVLTLCSCLSDATAFGVCPWSIEGRRASDGGEARGVTVDSFLKEGISVVVSVVAVVEAAIEDSTTASFTA